ncbi:MAG: hypothetical protein BGO67_08350 [Alphaproteobacteria bacterium 41-28]|nr:MAG: hypothetical protein BGO67_08350 [Alphaproteobacteria bacterium 41-28]
MSNLVVNALSKAILFSAVALGISLWMPSDSWSMIADKDILEEQVSPVKKVKDNFYIGKRPQDTDLNFCAVLLTEQNYPKWKKFAEEQDKACLRIWNEIALDEFESLPLETKRFLDVINVTRPSGSGLSIAGGLIAFRESLNIYEKYKSEVWIAYALAGNQIDPAQEITEKEFPHIEMVLTILTNSEAPFTLHMGICRTVYFEEKAFKKELQQHSRLAIPLHAFAAQAMKLYDPRKDWMTTRPTFKMAAILNESLPKGSYLKGMNEVDQAIQETDNELIIYGQDEERLLSLPLKEIKNDSNWGWYFSHSYFRGQPLAQYVVNLETLASQFDKAQ